MYKIELTRGQGWNAPVIEMHSVIASTHMAEVERMAERLLAEARRKPRGPDGYRIVDSAGRHLKANTPR